MPRATCARRKALVAAGSAAGVAAGFNAAISGVFFALETALLADRGGMGVADTAGGSREGEAPLVMVLLAAVVAAVVSSSVLGDDPAFKIPPYSLNSTVADVPASWLLGLASGGVSVAFLNLERASTRFFAFLERDADVPRGLHHQHADRPRRHGLHGRSDWLVRPRRLVDKRAARVRRWLHDLV